MNLDKIYTEPIKKGIEDTIEEFPKITGLNEVVHPLAFLSEIDQKYNEYVTEKDPERKMELGESLSMLFHGDTEHYSGQEGIEALIKDKRDLKAKYQKELPNIIDDHGSTIQRMGFSHYEDALNKLYEEVDGINDENKRTIKQMELESQFSHELINLVASIDPKNKSIEGILKAERALQGNADEGTWDEIIKEIYGENHIRHYKNMALKSKENMSLTAQMYMRIKQKKLVDSYRNSFEGKRIDINKIKSDLIPKLAENPKGYEGLVRNIYNKAKIAQQESAQTDYAEAA